MKLGAALFLGLGAIVLYMAVTGKWNNLINAINGNNTTNNSGTAGASGASTLVPTGGGGGGFGVGVTPAPSGNSTPTYQGGFPGTYGQGQAGQGGGFGASYPGTNSNAVNTSYLPNTTSGNASFNNAYEALQQMYLASIGVISPAMSEA